MTEFHGATAGGSGVMLARFDNHATSSKHAKGRWRPQRVRRPRASIMQVGRGVPDAPGTCCQSKPQPRQSAEPAGHFAHRVGLQLARGFLGLAHSG